MPPRAGRTRPRRRPTAEFAPSRCFPFVFGSPRTPFRRLRRCGQSSTNCARPVALLVSPPGCFGGSPRGSVVGSGEPRMTMQFALFYEIPVARPWSPDSEHVAYKNTLAQAIAGEQAGFHAFWTVEHHFLEEYSHCSNPEVLYGAIAARTTRMRLGYGVRLMPKPYNHPVRTAESVAVLDLLSDGRVDMGTGRSATRTELEGFGVEPKETREMWQEALGHVVGCWTNERTSLHGN